MCKHFILKLLASVQIFIGKASQSNHIFCVCVCELTVEFKYNTMFCLASATKMISLLFHSDGISSCIISEFGEIYSKGNHIQLLGNSWERSERTRRRGLRYAFYWPSQVKQEETPSKDSPLFSHNTMNVSACWSLVWWQIDWLSIYVQQLLSATKWCFKLVSEIVEAHIVKLVLCYTTYWRSQDQSLVSKDSERHAIKLWHSAGDQWDWFIMPVIDAARWTRMMLN